MKASYVYLLRSLKDGKFYTGWTTELERRLEEHNAESSISTKSRRPLELAYYETYSCPEYAKKRERALKRNPNMLFHFKKRALRNQLVRKGTKEIVDAPTTSIKKRAFSEALASEGAEEVVG